MKIKYNTAVSGFSVTTIDPADSEKREKTLNFHPLDLRIKKEILAKKSAIQAIFAKHFGVPDLFQNSKAFIGDGDGYICTPVQALSALTDLQKQDLMRDDRTIPLAELENSPEYIQVVRAAMEMGASHFHKPKAFLNVEIRVREPEISFVNDNFPKDILGAIGIYPYVPEGLAPLVQIARNVTNEVKSLAEATKKTWSIPITRRRCGEVAADIERVNEITAYVNIPEEYRNEKLELLGHLDAIHESLVEICQKYEWIESTRNILSGLCAALPMVEGSLARYDKRLVTSNTVVVKTSSDDSQITDDLDI